MHFYTETFFINFDDNADDGGYGFLKNMGPPFSMEIYVGCFFLNYANADPQPWNSFVQKVTRAFNDSHFTREIIESEGVNSSSINHQATNFSYLN